MRRYSTPPVLTEQETKRFWKRVSRESGHGPTGECWPWIAAAKWTSKKYATFTLRRTPGVKRTYSVHRLAFLLANGHLPQLEICHHCDWPPCCRPDHLYAATHFKNFQDAKDRDRIRHGSRHGMSKLTEAQVVEIRRLRAQNKLKYKVIADMFGVTETNIGAIIRGIQWQHVK